MGCAYVRMRASLDGAEREGRGRGRGYRRLLETFVELVAVEGAGPVDDGGAVAFAAAL